MDNKQQDECIAIIKKYRSYTSEGWRKTARNKLYLLIRVDILKWVKSIMRKWNRYEEETELISLSWDIFLFCLGHYKEVAYGIKGSIPKHFYEYTRYFLLMHYAKQQSVRVPLEELKEVLELVEEPENIAFGMLIRLYEFRDVIPEESKMIWDDAFLSMSHSGRNREKVKSKEITIDNACYLRIKRSFTAIISHLLEDK